MIDEMALAVRGGGVVGSFAGAGGKAREWGRGLVARLSVPPGSNMVFPTWEVARSNSILSPAAAGATA